MELTDAQRASIKGWAEEGIGLAEIQERLGTELGITMTYMDVRLLVMDMGLALQERASPVVSDLGGGTEPAAGAATDAPPEPLQGGGSGESPGPGSVSVEIDRLMKPGSVVSGSITFSDGVTAAWSLDQMGRLALEANRPGYAPSQDDLKAFQQELRQALEKRGF